MIRTSEVKTNLSTKLQVIYNSVNFIDSVFSPDEEYLAGYSDVYNAFLQNEEKAVKVEGIQNVVRQINKRAEFLPGTVSSIKGLIIEVIKRERGKEFVPLQTIYKKVEKIAYEKKLNYKLDTLRDSIRGELNKHETNSKHPDNMDLFIRSSKQKGYYSLTDKSEKYVDMTKKQISNHS